MTLQEVKRFRLGEQIEPSGSFVYPFLSVSVKPKSQGSLSVQESQKVLTAKDYNQLTLSDVSSLRVMKGRNPFVQADSAAAVVKRGNSMLSRLKKFGTQKFLKSYQS